MIDILTDGDTHTHTQVTCCPSGNTFNLSTEHLHYTNTINTKQKKTTKHTDKRLRTAMSFTRPLFSNCVSVCVCVYQTCGADPMQQHNASVLGSSSVQHQTHTTSQSQHVSDDAWLLRPIGGGTDHCVWGGVILSPDLSVEARLIGFPPPGPPQHTQWLTFVEVFAA